jgi:hypothetical protein
MPHLRVVCLDNQLTGQAGMFGSESFPTTVYCRWQRHE